ncbi:MAG TPA: right-handed parallel beta-helix repeat-containing protein [Candidatus Paceibacterota bacterium]
MNKKSINKISSVLGVLLLLLSTANVNASTISQTNVSTAVKSISYSSSIKIKDFGAHSIDEQGYSKFDSSSAINKAIQFAKQSGRNSIDFGNGRYYANNILLESNITYFSIDDAEIISSSNIKVWESIFAAEHKSNIIIKGLKFNGNWDVVAGNDQEGSMLVSLSTSKDVSIENCYFYQNKFSAISIQSNCNNITIKNNEIKDTDCGIITVHEASNYITIDNNIIYGNKMKVSEPIAIYNSNKNGLAHDITITNNTVYGKVYATGILVTNAVKVLIKNNNIYNCDLGIGIGVSSPTDSSVTICKNITITKNNIYDCISGGITAEVADSSIYSNIIHDIVGSGITLTASHANTFSTNTKIYDNTVTNTNSKVGNYEPAIRLQKSLNCVIENNIVRDTRVNPNNFCAIQVQGKDCNYNVVQNNKELGNLLKGGYSIYIQDAKNTTVKNNKANVLNQGTGTSSIGNKI